MGGLIACTMLSSRAVAPLGQMVGLLMQYHNAKTALTSLEEVMKKPVERPADASFVHRPELRGDIEFANVEFSYPGSSLPALKGFTCRIAAGEKVVIIGRIGSGKTTLQKLLLGLYQPTDGAVMIDGVDTRQLDPADLRRNIGYVSQEPTLFYGTLRDNIAIGAAVCRRCGCRRGGRGCRPDRVRQPPSRRLRYADRRTRRVALRWSAAERRHRPCLPDGSADPACSTSRPVRWITPRSNS